MCTSLRVKEGRRKRQRVFACSFVPRGNSICTHVVAFWLYRLYALLWGTLSITVLSVCFFCSLFLCWLWSLGEVRCLLPPHYRRSSGISFLSRLYLRFTSRPIRIGCWLRCIFSSRSLAARSQHVSG